MDNTVTWCDYPSNTSNIDGLLLDTDISNDNKNLKNYY